MNTYSPHLKDLKEALKELGIINPESITTRQASRYLSEIKGVPVAQSSLEVYRSTSRGPKYKKIGSRVFYAIKWLDEWADGVEIHIFDPNSPKSNSCGVAA